MVNQFKPFNLQNSSFAHHSTQNFNIFCPLWQSFLSKSINIVQNFLHILCKLARILRKMKIEKDVSTFTQYFSSKCWQKVTNFFQSIPGKLYNLLHFNNQWNRKKCVNWWKNIPMYSHEWQMEKIVKIEFSLFHSAIQSWNWKIRKKSFLRLTHEVIMRKWLYSLVALLT